jgi:hypothetical protein
MTLLKYVLVIILLSIAYNAVVLSDENHEINGSQITLDDNLVIIEKNQDFETPLDGLCNIENKNPRRICKIQVNETIVTPEFELTIITENNIHYWFTLTIKRADQENIDFKIKANLSTIQERSKLTALYTSAQSLGFKFIVTIKNTIVDNPIIKGLSIQNNNIGFHVRLQLKKGNQFNHSKIFNYDERDQIDCYISNIQQMASCDYIVKDVYVSKILIKLIKKGDEVNKYRLKLYLSDVKEYKIEIFVKTTEEYFDYFIKMLGGFNSGNVCQKRLTNQRAYISC